MMRHIDKYLLPVLLLLPLLLSCSKEGGNHADGRTPIRVHVDNVRTRVGLFEDGDDLVAEAGFAFHAYQVKSSQTYQEVTPYLYDTWVYYFEEEWQFRDDNGTPEINTDDDFYIPYWPDGSSLNFFAYMPRNPESGKNGVTRIVKNAGYPYFSCLLPKNAVGHAAMEKEFIYAYEAGRHELSFAEKGDVNLKFVHPFAVVNFYLMNSYRMTINSISLTNMAFEGVYQNNMSTSMLDDASFTYDLWTAASDTTTMKMVYEVDVPDPLNNYSLIGGPYIVMPQAIDDVKLVLEYTRAGVQERKSEHIWKMDHQAWQPGKRYTYFISLGDSEEEVLFRVLVDEWDIQGYKNEIDVQ